jgi:putative ABC transport system ATP-binding protein
MPIAALKDVYKTFETQGRTTSVLRGVTLEIAKGEFVCVMGPSGSGKSTMLHILSGLDKPSTGLAFLDGDNLAAMSAHACTLKRREVVGHVFQFFNLLPNLSARENIALPLAIKGAPDAAGDAAVEKLMTRLRIAERAPNLPHQLSGGEMQRTSIARALVGGQPLLLCDEPTGNLSQQAGLEVMHILREVCDRDKRTILLVTHNPRDAAFADRVVFLVDGKLASGVELKGPAIPVDEIHAVLAKLGI